MIANNSSIYGKENNHIYLPKRNGDEPKWFTERLKSKLKDFAQASTISEADKEAAKLERESAIWEGIKDRSEAVKNAVGSLYEAKKQFKKENNRAANQKIDAQLSLLRRDLDVLRSANPAIRKSEDAYIKERYEIGDDGKSHSAVFKTEGLPAVIEQIAKKYETLAKSNAKTPKVENEIAKLQSMIEAYRNGDAIIKQVIEEFVQNRFKPQEAEDNEQVSLKVVPNENTNSENLIKKLIQYKKDSSQSPSKWASIGQSSFMAQTSANAYGEFTKTGATSKVGENFLGAMPWEIWKEEGEKEAANGVESAKSNANTKSSSNTKSTKKLPEYGMGNSPEVEELQRKLIDSKWWEKADAQCYRETGKHLYTPGVDRVPYGNFGSSTEYVVKYFKRTYLGQRDGDATVDEEFLAALEKSRQKKTLNAEGEKEDFAVIKPFSKMYIVGKAKADNMTQGILLEKSSEDKYMYFDGSRLFAQYKTSKNTNSLLNTMAYTASMGANAYDAITTAKQEIGGPPQAVFLYAGVLFLLSTTQTIGEMNGMDFGLEDGKPSISGAVNILKDNLKFKKKAYDELAKLLYIGNSDYKYLIDDETKRKDFIFALEKKQQELEKEASETQDDIKQETYFFQIEQIKKYISINKYYNQSVNELNQILDENTKNLSDSDYGRLARLILEKYK